MSNEFTVSGVTEYEPHFSCGSEIKNRGPTGTGSFEAVKVKGYDSTASRRGERET
jgi:hypothetical protein